MGNKPLTHRLIFAALLTFVCLLMTTGLSLADDTAAPAISSGRSDAPEGISYLRDGLKALASSDYKLAAEKLSAAEDAFPLLGDYAAYNLAEAYHNLQDHAHALRTLRMMLKKYPDSPLRKKVRTAEIREAAEIEDPDVIKIYEAYLKDYPDEEEIALAYGLYLKQKTKDKKASAVLKGVYLKAGALTHSALAELSPSDITTDDLIEHALNLMKRYEFKEAERDLRKALERNDEKKRDDLLKNLGLALFRQKEYKAASSVYDKVNDQYFKARSLYRAGDKEGFDAALHDLILGQDKRAGSLLIAAASDKRREKNYDEALKIYDEALAKYPADAEEATWGIGWTYYLSADYKKASEVFSKLYDKYGDNKYLYWNARSLEESGEDAGRLYSLILKNENCFYSALTHTRTKEKPVSEAPEDAFIPVAVSPPPADSNHRIGRADALLSLGMKKEAVTELIYLSRKAESSPAMTYIISRLQELGEHKRAINLATRIPYTRKMHRFWYPLAYWEDVERISGKYRMDPFIALSVMREESRFDADARSVAGARGLMQLMPQTAFQMDKNIGLGIKKEAQINDVANNIHLGTYYLKSLFREFKSMPQVLAAYNAGELMVRKWKQQGEYKSDDEFIEDIPFLETRNYVKKVMLSYYQYKKTVNAVSEEAAADLSMLPAGP